MQFTPPLPPHIQNLQAQMAAIQNQIENNSWIHQSSQIPGNWTDEWRGSTISDPALHQRSAIYSTDGGSLQDVIMPLDSTRTENPFYTSEIFTGPTLHRKPSSADRHIQRRPSRDQIIANNYFNQQMLNNFVNPNINIPVNPENSQRTNNFLPPRPSKIQYNNYPPEQHFQQRSNLHEQQMRYQEQLRQQQLLQQQQQQFYQQQMMQNQQLNPQSNGSFMMGSHQQTPIIPNINYEQYIAEPNGSHINPQRRSSVGIGVTPPRSILTPSKLTPGKRAKSPGIKRVKFSDQR